MSPALTHGVVGQAGTQRHRRGRQTSLKIALEQYPESFQAQNGLRAASELGTKTVNAGDGGNE